MEREIENSAEIAANTIEPIEKKSRNCAFDIARIVAMFLIVCSHFLGHGGFIRNMTGANFVFGRILTSLFNPSVTYSYSSAHTSLVRRKNSNGKDLLNFMRKYGYTA